MEVESELRKQWADPYSFKNMKEALKFSMGFNERLVSTLEQKLMKLDESE